MRSSEPNDKDALEAMVDRNGLRSVLDLLAVVCHAKAEHVMTNWHDKTSAILWAKAAAAVQRTSTVYAVKVVSDDMSEA